MGRLLIIEGPDGGGKTTLTERLATEARKLGSVALLNHGAYLDEPAIAHHYLQSIEMAATFNTVIMDRCWISEPIYGQVMRGGKERILSIDNQYLSRKAARFDALVIFCLPSLSRCLTAWRSRRGIEYVKDEDKMIEIHQLYRHAFDDMYMIPKRLYDWAYDPTANCILKEVFK